MAPRVSLDAPPSYADLYTAHPIVPVQRPFMFGDVLKDVPCSRGGPPIELAMIVTHPCSMRHGVELQEEFAMAVINHEDKHVSRSMMQRGLWDMFVLEGLVEGEDSTVVNFRHLHSARSRDLLKENRVAALSERGAAIFLRRWIYQLSRYATPLDEIQEQIAPPFAEASLEERWGEAALKNNSEIPSPLSIEQVVGEASRLFQETLGYGKGSLRLLLESAPTDARTQIAKIRRDTYGS